MLLGSTLHTKRLKFSCVPTGLVSTHRVTTASRARGQMVKTKSLHWWRTTMPLAQLHYPNADTELTLKFVQVKYFFANSELYMVPYLSCSLHTLSSPVESV